ncbi:MAG: glycosyltransferase family 39 protein [Gaiellaceae bacterium]
MNRWRLGLGAVLALALGLRLWGFRHGLPFVYNADESAHFVPKAVRFFGEGYNPGYFKNPPGFTYLIHGLYAVWLGGDEAAQRFRDDPGGLFAVARVTSALLGTAAVGLVYAAGARLFDRRAGLLAAAVLAVAFLPVFYSHLALNDGPALFPVALALFGCAGILRRGRFVDYALAGAGLGLGAATKYTAGIVLVSLLVAAAAQIRPQEGRRRGVQGLALAAGVAFLAFFVANPYALLDFSHFREQLQQQGALAGRHKLGAGDQNGIEFYLWVFTWGLGWLPALAALLGAGAALVRDRWAGLMLALPIPLYLAYMATQERHFGRWLLPVFPVAAILAGYGALWLATRASLRQPRYAQAFVAAATVLLLAQGLVYSVHNDVVLTREDTRTATRNWMLENVPEGSQIVLEPAVPAKRWIREDGLRLWERNALNFQVESYAANLEPSLIDEYERAGACWVVSASTVFGRPFAEPYRAPNAIAYYWELGQRAEVVYRAVPWRSRVGFNFDWSFDWYPLRYHHPGPEMTVYRLRGGSCA